MESAIEKIKQATGIQEIEPLDSDKVEKILDAVNVEKVSAKDIQELVEIFPGDLLSSLALVAQGIRASADVALSTINDASSVQNKNLEGLTNNYITSVEAIKSSIDSLKTFEEFIKLLATQTQSNSFRGDAIRLIMDLAKLRADTTKLLVDLKKQDDVTRLELQKEHNRFLENIASKAFNTVKVIALAVVFVGGTILLENNNSKSKNS